MSTEFGQEHRRFLVDLRQQVLQLSGRIAIPDTPSNVRVTPQSFQNLIQFTKSIDADFYEVMHAQMPNQADPSATLVDIGDSASWVDSVGQVNIKKYYWIRARKLTGASSPWTPVASGTTLASGTGVTPPNPPPPASIVVLDQLTGLRIPYVLSGIPFTGRT